jgi:hypothetical protein
VPPRNKRLEKLVAAPLHEAKRRSEESGKPVRIFIEFDYRTLDTWSRERRVAAKAEHLPGRGNRSSS